ncbi:DUF6003 family protein [Streptomyces sp. CRN 30]|uniref:DUF6003 family protein n=1 Tax=Streptomyces sp. CRN 30 TaxID=3075613 RepID=UPI002A838C2F|nr:DUF6003 family protein [Streptomyces sp. CRN 30]
MTDDAYLFLLDDETVRLGVPPAALGTPACMETPAVLAWLAAHDVTATSRALRLLPPEDTAAVPEGAERLPVPLSDEELTLLRHHNAPRSLVGIEEELLAYRDITDGREALLVRALAAGVPLVRIAELTGEDPAAVAAATG